MDLALLPIGHSNELSSLASAVKHLLIRGVETCVGRREISWRCDRVNAAQQLFEPYCAPGPIATVTPLRLSTSSSFGISGWPGGISLSMAVNI